MKEDVLEQIMEDCLLKEGFFTMHNVRYRPDKEDGYEKQKDSVHSDIDILAYHPKTNEVKAVSCKSWQHGINLNNLLKNHKERINPLVLESKLKELYTPKIKDIWRGYRELMIPKWAQAFARTIKELTDKTKFTYCLAITRISYLKNTDAIDNFTNHFIESYLKMEGMDDYTINVEVKTFDEIFKGYWDDSQKEQTLESTEIGRLIQLMKASGLNFSKQKQIE